MIRFKTIMAAALAACALWSCTGERTPAQSVADARIEYESLNYGRCQQICDDILADSAKFDRLDVRQLCNLAELYVLIDAAVSNNNPTTVADVNDANATRCLARARALNADSVEIYIGDLPVEAATRLSVLNRVSSYLTIPRDSLVVAQDTNPDSL